MKQEKKNVENVQGNVQKEEQKSKKTKKLEPSKLMVRLVLPIAIIAILVGTIYGVIFNRTQNLNTNIDPELARAMEYPQVIPGEEKIEGTDYVQFDAFFLRDLDEDGYAESVRGTCREVTQTDTLYMELKVLTNGYLKEGATITINNENFYLETAILKDNEISKNYISSNTKTITLNKVMSGTQKLLMGTVNSGDNSYSTRNAIKDNIENYSKINSITLRGTHVETNETGEIVKETPIVKTVQFNVDWHRTIKCSMYASNLDQHNDIESVIDEKENKLKLQFYVRAIDEIGESNLSKSYVEGTIPEFNGYKPVKVEVTGTDVEYTYDENTMKFTAKREAEVNEKGIITKSVSDDNRYDVKLEYPLDAYNSLKEDTIVIKIPVQAYYEGFNNKNNEFTNPYKSNVKEETIVATYERRVGEVFGLDVYVGEYDSLLYRDYIISKEKPLKIYNEQSVNETNDIYTVRWNIRAGEEGSPEVTLKETEDGKEQVSDVFIKSTGGEESMSDITTNVGIYFSGATYSLGDDGTIEVYDAENNQLITTFTKETWDKYDKNNPYRYETPIKNVIVKTSKMNERSSMNIWHIKEIDDEVLTNKYSKEEFDKLSHIKSTLVGYIWNQKVTDIEDARYISNVSIANVSIDKSQISTQETMKNAEINITTNYDSRCNMTGWQDGTFLLKFPEQILNVNINDVTINRSSVKILSYEKYEEAGSTFIKIYTEGYTTSNFSIKINSDITPNPMIESQSSSIVLYAANGINTSYYYSGEDIYDVNDNLDKSEMVHKSSTYIGLISPQTLVTSQSASNYDETDNVVIAPNIVPVSKEQRKATVNIEILNNYTNAISDIVIIGKIPYTDNSYVINGGNLDSKFTTTMSSTGISVPSELQGKTKIYYSNNDKVNNNLQDLSNEWKDTDIDFDNVKSFMIVIENYTLPHGEIYKFSYEINIPKGLEYNQIAYSHHGIYFNLNTDQGKYRTQTEPNKLGFRIEKRYDLELTKYHKGITKVVSGATYSITAEGDKDAKIRKTDEEGKLLVEDLYAGKVYTIKEIKSPIEYELNENEVKFNTDEVNGELIVKDVEGEHKGEINVSKEKESDYTVQIGVEDEIKANLKILKTGENNTPIKGVKFRIKGEGLPESGRVVTTGTDGDVIVKGINVGKEYTLQEEKTAEGYYLSSQIVKFNITNSEGNYTESIIEGTTKNHSIAVDNYTPTVTIELENEKIPTYNLTIKKVEKNNEENLLSGARFKLIKEGKEIGRYETGKKAGTDEEGEQGKVTIPNLYVYEETRKIDQTYTLEEIQTPQGFTKIKNIVFSVTKNEDETYSFNNTEGIVKSVETNGNNITITIEDSPSFVLTKQDAENATLLPDTKFVIYNIDNGDTPAKNSKGEILGEKQEIDGVEYNVLTTDAQGKITADLPQGVYKAIEVQASDDKYKLADTQYFGVGMSKEVPTMYKVDYATQIGDSEDEISIVIATEDGGYIVGGKLKGSNINVGKDTQDQDVILTSEGGYDGLIIKYNKDDKIDWATLVGGNDDDYITTIAETNDGYLVGGDFKSKNITIGSDELTNKGSSGTSDGMLIEYNKEGQSLWAMSIGSDENEEIRSVDQTNDGGYIVGGYSDSYEIIFDENNSLRNGGSYGFFVKYSANRNVESVGQISKGDSNLYVVLATSDGGYIIGGGYDGDRAGIAKYAQNNEEQWQRNIWYSYREDEKIKQIIETNNSYIAIYEYTLRETSGIYSEILRFNSQGEVEKEIGCGVAINSLISTKDGGYAVAGTYDDAIFIRGDEKFNNFYGDDSIIVKYNSNDEIENIVPIVGKDDEIINSIAINNEGEYIIAGKFSADSIDIQDDEFQYSNDYINLMKYKEVDSINVINNTVNKPIKIDAEMCTASTNDGGYIIGISEGFAKYNANNEIEWEEIITGEKVKSLIVSRDGGYVINTKDKIIKYNEERIMEWQILLNGDKCIQQTIDGKYIVAINNSLYKYNEKGKLQWQKEVDDKIYSISISTDGGYIVRGKDNKVIKYSADGNIQWIKEMQGTIETVVATSDGGFIVGGYFTGKELVLDSTHTLFNSAHKEYYDNDWSDSDGMIIKYSSSNAIEWAKTLKGEGNESITCIKETKEGDYLAGGYFVGSVVKAGQYILSNMSMDYESGEGDTETSYDGILIKYDKNGKVIGAIQNNVYYDGDEKVISISETTMGKYILQCKLKEMYYGEISQYLRCITMEEAVKEQEELIVENEIKTFKVTTEVEGGIGGTIEVENKGQFEIVKYNETSNAIIITPQEEYEIAKVTINGKIFTELEQFDGSYKVPAFPNMKENKHVVVTFVTKVGKLIINKKDSDEVTPLAGAKFRIEQVDEREVSQDIIGNIENNGQEYTEEDEEKPINNALDDIQKNGPEYIEADEEKPINNALGEIQKNGEEYIQGNDMHEEITGILGDIVNNGPEYEEDGNQVRYYFAENGEGTYISNNVGKVSTIASSYIPINLENTKGKVTLVVNAQISSKGSNYGRGFAVITTNTIMPTSSYTGTSVVPRIYGQKENTEYKVTLEGGKQYYLHFVYEKGSSSSETEEGITDTFTINSVKTYKPEIATYYFEGDGEGPYKSNNQQKANTTANSYIPIDLRSYPEQKIAIVVNAEISSYYYNYGYATITNSPNRVGRYDNTSTRFINISGDQPSKDYTILIDGGKEYYLHLGYYKDYSGDSGTDTFTVNSVKIYETKIVTYGFDSVGDRYISNNKEKESTIASSYIPLNLAEHAGKKIAVVVNAQISSQAYSDYGYATITTSTNYPTSSSTGTQVTGQLYGEKQARDYTAIVDVQEGQQYYLHFVYWKDATKNEGTDEFTINSVKVYESKVVEYNFETIETRNDKGEVIGKKYVSTNKGKHNTEANSYVQINLKELTGNYNVIVNAQVSSEQSGDYGYVKVTSDSSRPTSTYGSFIDISGTTSKVSNAKDYTTKLAGGQIYYLHFGYKKNGDINSGADTFTINSISVVPNRDDMFSKEVITDEIGQAILNVPLQPTAMYSITELEAPNGYEKPNNAIIAHTMTNSEEDGENEVTFYNTKKPKLIVHHYLKGTDENLEGPTKVAEDEEYFGTMNGTYETKPRTDLETYELEVDEENGGYILPPNANGTYEWSEDVGEEQRKNQLVIEVTYHYVQKKIPLIVHHYIEGTKTPVPLKEGTQADIITEGNENDPYETTAINAELLDEKYELAGTPENSTGTYQYPAVEVTYEYKVKTYEVKTRVEKHTTINDVGEEEQVDGGTISGQEQSSYERVPHGESNKKPIIITPEEKYQVGRITINGVDVTEAEYTKDEETGIVTLKPINNITQDQEVVVTFEKVQAKIIVHHYIYDRLQEEHTNQKVLLKNGDEAEDDIITGSLGDVYISKEKENIQTGYELYERPENDAGFMEKRIEEINYYYIQTQADIEQSITKEGTEIITSKDEELTYNINYTASIHNYKGNAVITIIDTLPYALDKEAMKKVAENKGLDISDEEIWLKALLDNGTYTETPGSEEDIAQGKNMIYTITWTETKEEINTEEQENGIYEASIGKKINVIFKDIDVIGTSLKNKVQGVVQLETTEQLEKTDQVAHETKTNFTKNIKVTKTWKHGNNTKYKPTQIILQIKNGENIVDSYTVSEQDNWMHIFTGLPKYDAETGEEIEYTVDEQAIEGEEELLKYYEQKQ